MILRQRIIRATTQTLCLSLSWSSLASTDACSPSHSLSLALSLFLSLSLVHSPFSVSPPVVSACRSFFLPHELRSSVHAHEKENTKNLKYSLKILSQYTTNTHALRSLAPSHATPHLCLSALFFRRQRHRNPVSTPRVSQEKKKNLASARLDDARPRDEKNSKGRDANANRDGRLADDPLATTRSPRVNARGN